MTETAEFARSHYNVTGLVAKIREALLRIAPEDQRLTVDDIAAMDQFHTGGMRATRDLAALTAISRETRVLDLGCGIGGPARLLAATFGCPVSGIDQSENFIDAANYLTGRCAMGDQVSFRVGNALAIPFDSGAFDLVFLQHVAMNIQDRAALYAEIRRVLAPGGRLAMYDVILEAGDVRYPVPWAHDASASFLLTEGQTRDALVAASLIPSIWKNESDSARAWFGTLTPGSRQPGPTLAVVLGPDFPALTANLRGNLEEGRIGILSAIAERR